MAPPDMPTVAWSANALGAELPPEPDMSEIVTLTVAVASPPRPSLMVYEKESDPDVTPGERVNDKPPPEFRATVPNMPCVKLTRVSGSPSISESFISGNVVPDVPCNVIWSLTATGL